MTMEMLFWNKMIVSMKREIPLRVFITRLAS